MSKINNPHDKFTKSLLSDKGVAIAFLQEYLPDDVKKHLDLSTIEITSNSYISKQLKEQFSDIVYVLKTRQENMCEVSIFIEHKSYVDKYVSVQLLGYMYEAMSERIKNKKPIIPIIPIIYYHGKDKWQIKTLREIMSEYEVELLKYVPEFSQVFIDLKSAEEEDILKLHHQLLKAMLLIQKMIGNSEDEKRILPLIFSSLEDEGSRNYIVQFFVYLLSATDTVEEILIEEIKKLPQGIKSELMTTYDQILEKGIKKGVEQGVEQGLKKGMTQTILKGFDKGLSLDLLAAINDTSEEEVINILQKHGKL